MRTSTLLLFGLVLLVAAEVVAKIVMSKVDVQASTIELTGVRGERTYDALPLKHLRVVGQIRVILSPGTASTRIEADEALLDVLADTDPSDETLSIELPLDVLLTSGSEVVAYIQTPTLESIKLDNASSLSSSASLPFEELKVESSGSTNLDLELASTQRLSLSTNGSANINLRGSVTELVGTFSGSGQMDAGDLYTSIVRLSSAGSTSSIARADSLLTWEASGSGDLGYYGRPEVELSTSGSGQVRTL